MKLGEIPTGVKLKGFFVKCGLDFHVSFTLHCGVIFSFILSTSVIFFLLFDKTMSTGWVLCFVYAVVNKTTKPL